MTYDAKETSDQSGQPIELYEFEVDGVTYRYTSSAKEYIVGLLVYDAFPIERSEIDESGELPKNNLSITAHREFPVAEFFRVAPPSNVVVARIKEVHANDPDQQVIVKWYGRVLSVDWQGASVVLNCENQYTSLKRPGLRRAYGRGCPHVLYGSSGCRLLKADFAATFAITSANGTEISASGFDAQPDGFYDGGFIEWERLPGVFDRRAIRSHVGPLVVVTHAFAGLAPGDMIIAYPGCDHTFATCDSKFDNTDNYGGFPNIPQLNPFGGSNIF